MRPPKKITVQSITGSPPLWIACWEEMLTIIIFLFLGFSEALTPKAETDRIESLPGLSFQYSHRQFSGYLNATKRQDGTHYWFLESQKDPTNDPLILFVTKASCSSIFKLFAGIGPFRLDKDGKTLHENIFSWNKVANLLFIDAFGVGFTEPKDEEVPSDEILSGIYKSAVLKFFEVFPEFSNSGLFITGDDGGSHFMAIVFKSLVDDGSKKQLGFKLKGLIIANENLLDGTRSNFHFPYSYMHGKYTKSDLEEMSNRGRGTTCEMRGGCNQHSSFIDSVEEDTDFYRTCYGGANIYNYSLKAEAVNFSDSYRCYWSSVVHRYLNQEKVKEALHVTGETKFCTKKDLQNNKVMIWPLIVNMVCSDEYKNANAKILVYNGVTDVLNNFIGSQIFGRYVAVAMLGQFHDKPWFFNLDSKVYQWNVGGLETSYGGTFSIVSILGAGRWSSLTNSPQLLQLIRNFVYGYNISVDVSDVNFEPAPLKEKYLEKIDESSSTKQENDISTSLSTVLTDKKYINLEALSNWLRFKFVTPGTTPRERQDRILNLPGLEETLNFRQYSGFLNGYNEHRIHFWLVEAEVSDASRAPLILSLNGKYWESSLTGLFQGGGPFRIRKDGASLYLNRYSWNKFANILYLDSPVSVGYSYKHDENHFGDKIFYNDQKAADEIYSALRFFFEIYPKFSGCDFYIVGESYGSVHATYLAAKIVRGLIRKEIHVKYKLQWIEKMEDSKTGVTGAFFGTSSDDHILIPKLYIVLEYHGVAYGSSKNDWMWNTFAYPFSYYHGMIPQTYYNQHTLELKSMSPNQSDIITMLFDKESSKGDMYEIRETLELEKKGRVFHDSNIYRQCLTVEFAGKSGSSEDKTKMLGVNYDLYDDFDNYPCYMKTAFHKYFQRSDVKSALNIPEEAPGWTIINSSSEREFVYEMMNPRSRKLEHQLLHTISEVSIPSRILFYNGDLDFETIGMDVSMSTKMFFKNLDFDVTLNETSWTHKDQDSQYVSTAGNYMQIQKYHVGIDVVTVRGAGASVALDRPRESLQMMYNFIYGLNYSTPFVNHVNGADFS